MEIASKVCLMVLLVGMAGMAGATGSQYVPQGSLHSVERDSRARDNPRQDLGTTRQQDDEIARQRSDERRKLQKLCADAVKYHYQLDKCE